MRPLSPGSIVEQLRDICAILCGLLVAADFRNGQKVLSTKEFSDFEKFFQESFEIARRYKVCAPPPPPRT